MAQLQSLAYAPGTLREYETIYILRPETVSDKVAEVNTRVRGIIETGGGKVINLDNWGKRRLAYEVKKELKGIYLYWLYLGSPEIVAEFERNLRMLDPVIRYMTVRRDENVDPSARPTDFDDEKFERASITAADEDELEEEALGYGAEGDGEEAEKEGADASTSDTGPAAAAGDASTSDAEPAEAAGDDSAPADDDNSKESGE